MIHQEFLDIDYRKNRDPRRGLPSTDELTIHKHEVLLPRERIQGRRILDLGCFMGATADWCLQNGAAGYTGVEISQEFAHTARQLLTKYHAGGNWTVVNQGYDQFFHGNQDRYDIVFAWGVLPHVLDHAWILGEMAKRADQVIVAARPPKVMWRDHEITPDYLRRLEYEIPYTEYHNGGMSLMYSPELHVSCTSANSSLAAVCLIMELHGFRADLTAYEHFKQLLPERFGMFADFDHPGYYIADFQNAGKATKHTYEQLHYDPSLIEVYVDPRGI